MKKTTSFFVLATFLLFTTSALFAQNHDDHESHESEIGHYHFSAFGGATTNFKGKNGYKLGLEYEYRLTDFMGLGGTFDFTGADFDIFAFSVGTTFYPFDFPLIPAIGVGAKSYEGHWDPFIRGLLVYDFHLENMSIGPMLMYDAFPKQKNILSFGLTVGFSI